MRRKNERRKLKDVFLFKTLLIYNFSSSSYQRL